MNELIKEAIDNLKIDNVRLRSSEVKLTDQLRPEQVGELSLTPESFSGVQAITSAVGQSDEDIGSASLKVHLYTFRYSVGVRLVGDKQEDGNNDESEVDSLQDDSTAVEIRATFDTEYSSQKELDEAILKEFAKSNVGYHVWPYWREFVQSTAGRMCIPSGVLSVPFYFVPTGQQKETDTLAPEQN